MGRGRGRTWIQRVAVAAAVVSGACGGEEPAASVVVDSVGGVERLTYPEGGAAALDWTADTVAVIGAAMGPAEYQFGTLGSDDLAGDDRGGVVVVDRDGSRVLEYGPDGRHRATYGREGEGPGELKFASGVTVGPADTIWVNDLMNRRITGFPRGGGEPRSVPYTRSDVYPGSRIALHDTGFLQVVGAIGAPGESIPEPLLRLDRSLNILDTLWVPPSEPIDVVEIEMGNRSIVLGMSQQFWPEFHWRALSGGAAVVADSADYVFRVIGPDGAVRRIVRRAPPARAATEADRDAVREGVLAEAEEGGGIRVGGGGPDADARRRMAEQRVDRMTFFDRIPRIVALQVDPADRIWVGVSEGAPDEVERIDIYDRSGDLMGELRGMPMPEAFAGDDRILVTRTDELDVPQVVVLRLDRAATE